jgi:hypothetical protein
VTLDRSGGPTDKAGPPILGNFGDSFYRRPLALAIATAGLALDTSAMVNGPASASAVSPTEISPGAHPRVRLRPAPYSERCAEAEAHRSHRELVAGPPGQAQPGAHARGQPPRHCGFDGTSPVNSRPAVLRFSPVRATAKGSLTLTVPEAARSARQPLGQVVWEGLISIGAGIGVFEALEPRSVCRCRLRPWSGWPGSAGWVWAHKKWTTRTTVASALTRLTDF